MKTYPVLNKEGLRAPIFQIENVYIGPAAVARVLGATQGVTDVRPRKMFAKSADIHIEFKYLGRSYIVWEPYGDNSRYWIGPADMVQGAPDVPALDSPGDIDELARAFKLYRPPIYRALLGDVLTLRVFKRLFGKES